MLGHSDASFHRTFLSNIVQHVSAGNLLPFPPLSHSLCLFSVSFHVLVHSGHLCMNGKPRAVDAQFWLGLAGWGHPLSHWASHQWLHCGLLIKGTALNAEAPADTQGENNDHMAPIYD